MARIGEAGANRLVVSADDAVVAKLEVPEDSRMRKGICITQRNSQGKAAVVLTEYDDGMRHDMSAVDYELAKLEPPLSDLSDCPQQRDAGSG
jgi:hypothetical protein